MGTLSFPNGLLIAYFFPVSKKRQVLFIEKANELSGVKLDILVAEAIGIDVFYPDNHNKLSYVPRPGMNPRE